jgi:hypothetical protein
MSSRFHAVVTARDNQCFSVNKLLAQETVPDLTSMGEEISTEQISARASFASAHSA